jgi:hypothetical protein
MKLSTNDQHPLRLLRYPPEIGRESMQGLAVFLLAAAV